MGAASAVVGSKLYAFGGVSPGQGCWLADMLIVDVAKDGNTLETIPASFDGPSPRDKAAMVACGGHLILFGGFGPLPLDPEAMQEESDSEDSEDGGMDPAKFQWFDDLWIFNIANRKWRRIQSLKSPPARAAHSMSLSGGRVWLFGGKSQGGRVADLWSVGASDLFQNSASIEWQMHDAGGVIPSGRSFQTLVPISNSRLLLFGGTDNSDLRLNDIHIYDCEINAWAQPSFISEAPIDFLGSATVHENHLILLGGPTFATADLSPAISAKFTLPPPPQQEN